jgi:hypothetical protein
LALKKRLESIRRIVQLKEQQCRSVEWSLARLEREEKELLAEQDAVLAALNAEQPLHGLFVETMAKHLRMIARRLDALRQREEAERAQLQLQKGQLRHSERLRSGVERAHLRWLENKELLEIVDAAAARGGTSLP